jgi:MoxR-like ATPase
MTTPSWRVYGDLPTAKGQRDRVPAVARRKELEQDPAGYFVSPELADAVNVAIALGQPLLLTGEPGTGKTQLAHHLAYRLFGEGATPIIFNTKTTSTARDLFYGYDAIRHFRDAQLARVADGNSQVASSVEDYITYQGLGLAILLANPRAKVAHLLPPELRDAPVRQSVVLIDEIDKAPRDLPNDVLDEIERMRFEVKETGARFEAPEEYRPIVILTSNSERLLPDPFLRRCVFHHLEYPEQQELLKIVSLRLGLDEQRPDPTKQWIAAAIKKFEEIRARLNRKPATAELLGWLRLLEEVQRETGTRDPLSHPSAKAAAGALAKNKEDRSRMTTI